MRKLGEEEKTCIFLVLHYYIKIEDTLEIEIGS
jgi:hypothetical protein